MSDTNRRIVDVLNLRRGCGPILFGVHGSGAMLFFGRFARHLDSSLSFYAVQARDLFSLDVPYKDLYDLASAYADELNKLQPSGCFYICGRWSSIVMEVSQQLLLRGRQVALAIVCDVNAPPLNPEPYWKRHAVLRKVRQVYRWLGGHNLRDGIGRLYRGGEQRSARLPRKFSPRVLNRMLLVGYYPKKYPSKVVLIRSSEFAGRKSKDRHITNWRALVDDLVIHVLDTTHRKMWHPPDVRVLAETIENEIKNSGTCQPVKR